MVLAKVWWMDLLFRGMLGLLLVSVVGGGGYSGMGSFSVTNNRTSTLVTFGNGTGNAMSCSGSTCTVSGGSPCNGGWRIFAECPVN